MEHFGDRLMKAVEKKHSCVVAGLDPRVENLPPELREKAAASLEAAAAAILEFNRRVIEAIAPHAVAVKPQSAFYEALGWQGVRAYAETIHIAHEHDLLVIGDVKRGDIGSTAEAYAEAHLDLFDADAITVNPYLGTDGIMPFAARAQKGKGLFVLVKTSNPSSGELQDLDTGGIKFYERVAELVEHWGSTCRGRCGYSAIGAVVGVTWPEHAVRLRELMPRAIFLAPGYGAQGGTAADCKPLFDSNGLGAVVNSSRGIINAYAKPPRHDWQNAIAEAADRMRLDLEPIRTSK